MGVSLVVELPFAFRADSCVPACRGEQGDNNPRILITRITPAVEQLVNAIDRAKKGSANV